MALALSFARAAHATGAAWLIAQGPQEDPAVEGTQSPRRVATTSEQAELKEEGLRGDSQTPV